MRISAAVLIALIPLSLSAQTRTVVFSELMWMGSSASSADEWIELANRTDHALDLAGWTITRVTGTQEKIMLRIPNGTLNVGKAFLIANYPADDGRSRLATKPDLVSAAVSLPNTKLDLRLYDGDPETGATLIDRADDGTGAPMAGDAKLKRAMVRVRLDDDGTNADSWRTAEHAQGWDPGATELGTPGYLDSATEPTPSTQEGASESETAIRGVSWAHLKARPR